MADMDIKYIRKDNSTHVHTVDGVDYIYHLTNWTEPEL